MLNEIDSAEGQSRRGFRLTPLSIGVSLFLILVIVTGLFLYIRSGVRTMRRSQEAKEKAVAELSQIKPMPGSLFVRRGTTSSDEHGTVTDHYRSRNEYASIRDYYTEEFGRLGWKVEAESKMPVWGEDVGAVELRFCKNGDRANLFFLGKQPTGDNITYTIGTSWGWGCRGF